MGKSKREITYKDIDEEDEFTQEMFRDAVVLKGAHKVIQASEEQAKENADTAMRAALGMIDDKTQDIGFEQEGVGRLKWGKRERPTLNVERLAEILVVKYEVAPKDVGEAIKEATTVKVSVFPEFRAVKGVGE